MERSAKWVRVSWVAGVLLPLAAGSIGAANGNATSSATPASRLARTQDLLGVKIVNSQGDQIAVVADVVLTPDRDAVNYVVLSTGWTSALPDKYYAVPWSRFELPPGGTGKVLILSGITRAQLDEGRGFNQAHWPSTASADWLRGDLYLRPPPGGGPAPLPSSNVQNHRLSKLLGTTVRNPQNGAKLGTLEGLMIDTIKAGSLTGWWRCGTDSWEWPRSMPRSPGRPWT